MHLEIAAEIIAKVGNFPITNTMLMSWVTTLVLVTVSIFATKKIKEVPSGLQNFMEMIIEGIYKTIEDLAHEKTKLFFPFLATFFLFIIVSNWLGLFPGMGTIGIWEDHDGEKTLIPLFRSVNTDLNITLGLALFSVVLTHFYSIKFLGLVEYLKRWFSLNPIFLFVGLLELVGEFTKVVSLSFRLFGNIFAGEVVLSTVASIFKWSAFLVPLPFYFLEIIVGFVQAAVFMMLTLVFMVLLTQKHTGEEH